MVVVFLTYFQGLVESPYQVKDGSSVLRVRSVISRLSVEPASKPAS